MIVHNISSFSDKISRVISVVSKDLKGASVRDTARKDWMPLRSCLRTLNPHGKKKQMKTERWNHLWTANISPAILVSNHIIVSWLKSCCASGCPRWKHLYSSVGVHPDPSFTFPMCQLKKIQKSWASSCNRNTSEGLDRMQSMSCGRTTTNTTTKARTRAGQLHTQWSAINHDSWKTTNNNKKTQKPLRILFEKDHWHSLRLFKPLHPTSQRSRFSGLAGHY